MDGHSPYEFPVDWVVFSATRDRLVIVQKDGRTNAANIQPKDITVVFAATATPLGDSAATVEVRPTMEQIFKYLQMDREFHRWLLGQQMAGL